jgi:Ras family protein A
VTGEEGLALAQSIGAVNYIECSAITGENLKLVFDTAVKSVICRPRKRSKGTRVRSLTGKRRHSAPADGTEAHHRKCVLM